MQERVNANQRIWFDPTLLTESPDHCFESEFWLQAGKVIGSAQGRGTTWFVQGEKLEMALRHYRRGGLFGKLVKDAYWFTGWLRTRGAAELLLLEKLVQGGVRVPRPVAARAIRTGLTYQADLLVEKVPGARDLVALLELGPLPPHCWRAIGEMVRQMHNLQVCHTDLNSHNILLDQAEQVWLIDFDKCGERKGDGWKAKNLARLQRSFLKEQRKRGIQFDPQCWAWLLDGYQSV
ncbi:3-deoxy-D-manno-octulosonic acid kinase [Photobacterium aphoticum]|uniref:3-deoxy-D-manno-octulosonic acid kinase n=1 Tax=Photobacterium aphoticum TaxID=754436 RepID=A0A0J1GJ32_9GAMM|nr:3-deoxy-D-manno-octulosonic acid kinase [Photobacterium aphoticum]KLU99679.1 3-deoxy-D-manno-octulosonic acid kinase [Photobacterium aphoticum]PSU55274.1 3-deoxy-D-manno-octulosonic acid kinase [Photobacterium aphoticum]GHA43854.1 3-deoxy-D-manno-octulosonic acid kinase [Photobacterium aphoticum]